MASGSCLTLEEGPQRGGVMYKIQAGLREANVEGFASDDEVAAVWPSGKDALSSPILSNPDPFPPL